MEPGKDSRWSTGQGLRVEHTRGSRIGSDRQPTKHQEGCADWRWHQEVQKTPTNLTSENTLDWGERLEKQHSQHRRDLPGADGDSDPVGNHSTQQRCRPEQVPYQLPDDLEKEYFIIDTQSMYSYIGEDTIGELYATMKAAGWYPPEIEETSRIFKDRENRPFRARELLSFDTNLTGIPTAIEVYIVPGRIPFTIGQYWMEDNNMEPVMAGQKVKMDGIWIYGTDMGLGRLGVRWSVLTNGRAGNSMHVLRGRGLPIMRGPEWDRMSKEMEMKMSTTPGQGDTGDPEWRTSEEDSDWTSIEEDKPEPRTTPDPEWRTSDEDGSDWTSMEEDKPEQRTTSEEYDSDWGTRDERRTRDDKNTDWDALEEVTSEMAKTGYPDNTVEEDTREDETQRDLLPKESITKDRTKRTFIVITATEKGKPKAIDVLTLQHQTSRKTTYVRLPVEYRSKAMRTVWETIKDLYRLKEANVLCTQAASTFFKVNGDQMKERTPNRMLGSLKARTDSAGIWRLWTKRSKNPTKKRGCPDDSGLSRPRTKGKKKKMQITTSVSRTKVKEQCNKLNTLKYNIELEETGELQSHTNTQEHQKHHEHCVH